MTLDVALAYAASGWCVFPVIPRGKRPACQNGLDDGTTDPDRIKELWSGNLSLNVGIATGHRSGVFVVDVDGETGEQSLANLPPLPPTLTAKTANGYHYYFAMPEQDLRNSQNKIGVKIDIRANGGYVVAPSSQHENGHIYRWVDPAAPVAAAPDWLIATLMAERPKADIPRQEPTDGDGFTVEDVERMLGCISPDIQYDEWLSVGMALHEGKFQLQLWDTWSRCGQKYRTGDCLGRWMKFKSGGGTTMGTLVHLAKQWGWKPTPRIAPDHDEDPDIRRIRENWAQRKKFVRPPEVATQAVEPVIVAPKAVSALSFDPMDLPGLVGDTVRWIVGSAVKPQPELALLNTLAALGSIFGRRYVSPLKTCTNVYMVGIAATVSGKDHSRKQIKTLMLQADLTQFLGADGVRSGVGVMKSLLPKPSQIMHLDEFGMLMQAMADIKGAAYIKAFGKNLLELYSSASSTYDIGSVADAKSEDIIIHQPSLCIYGTTTLETYAPALNRSAISSGSLNRFIVLPTAVERPVRRRSIIDYDAPPALIEKWAALATKMPFWSGATRAQPDVVDWPGCEDRIFDLGLYEDEQYESSPMGTGSLWGRYRENVIKVAMIKALSRNDYIRHHDLDFAEEMVRPSVLYMQKLAMEHMSDSQHESDCQEALRHLRLNGGQMLYSELSRSCRRLSSKQMSDVITSLIEQERVIVEQCGLEGRGRPGRLVRVS